MLQSIISAVGLLGGIGIVVGVVLAAASKIFYVYVDPKILAVEGALPGANCGGCGLPGCSANAEAIVAGRAAPNSCVAAGPDVAQIIASILGVSVEAKEPDIARPGCYYGVQDADPKYRYDGLGDCRAAAALAGGMKVCSIGCLGLGTCARACPFHAIVMGPDNLPVVDPVKCTGCGTCERVCPKHIITLSSVTRRILREYTTDECTTPCQRACPAGIDIREYIRQIAQGDYLRAVQVIKERNPFPTVIGRICPRPCETDCRRQLAEEPVAINFLKRFAADYERARGERVQPFKAPETGRRVAVVGGGVEGLSTAFFTARLGHSATVYEGADQLGGLLRTAIARNRLPLEVLDWDIQGILEMGVTAHTGRALGRDLGVAQLLGEGYEAVFLASGGWDSRLARGGQTVVEKTLPGSLLLIDFLRSARQGAVAVGAEVVIVGGGRLAAEAAALCRRAGAASVTLLLRESVAAAPLNAEAVEALTQDGVRVIFNAGVVRLAGEADQLTSVTYVDLAARTPVELPAQTLLLAAGRFPEMIFIPAPAAAAADAAQGEATGAQRPIRWLGILPYKPPTHSEALGLYSVGDQLTDFSGAIKAIGAGRRAAASIHQLMVGIDPGLPETVVTPESVIQNVYAVEDVAPEPRQLMPLAPESDTRSERELGFSEEPARREAARCLQCGLICYERRPAAPVTIEDQRRSA